MYQGLAQNLIRSIHRNQTVADFASLLASIADQAYDNRQLDVVGYAGQLLLSLPLSRQAESVGHYYEALSLNRNTRGDTAHAGSMFEQVADDAPLQYRAKAMLGLGANSFAAGDHQAAMSFYREAMRVVSRHYIFEPVTLYTASRMTAVIRGMNGDHRGAVRYLESIYPLARMASVVQPYVYYDYLNTLGVELMEAGRLEEATNASQIVLASPFASAYREWRETRDEIELRGWRASRATIAVNQHATEVRNLVRLPVRERGDTASHEESIVPHTQQRARVLDLLEWKKKMVKEPNDTPQDKKSFKDMDGREMLLKIMELTGARERTDDELLRILEAIERVLSEPKNDDKQ